MNEFVLSNGWPSASVGLLFCLGELVAFPFLLCLWASLPWPEYNLWTILNKTIYMNEFILWKQNGQIKNCLHVNLNIGKHWTYLYFLESWCCQLFPVSFASLAVLILYKRQTAFINISKYIQAFYLIPENRDCGICYLFGIHMVTSSCFLDCFLAS